MRYEGKSEQDAVEQAVRTLGKPAAQLRYRVLRDEKSFWGGRVVEIEVEDAADAGRRKAEDDAVTEPPPPAKPPESARSTSPVVM